MIGLRDAIITAFGTSSRYMLLVGADSHIERMGVLVEKFENNPWRLADGVVVRVISEWKSNQQSQKQITNSVYDSVACNPVKTWLSELKIEVEEYTNHNVQFQALTLVLPMPTI